MPVTFFVPSITPEHAVHKITQRAPEILSTSKTVLIDEEDVMLEAGVEVCFEAKFADNWVVVAIDVGVNTVHSLENLADHAWERLRERDTYRALAVLIEAGITTCLPILLGNTASLSMLLRTQPIKCSMYVGAGIFVGRLKFSESCQRYSNSSVAFISGHDCGEQNSVIDP